MNRGRELSRRIRSQQVHVRCPAKLVCEQSRGYDRQATASRLQHLERNSGSIPDGSNEDARPAIKRREVVDVRLNRNPRTSQEDHLLGDIGAGDEHRDAIRKHSADRRENRFDQKSHGIFVGRGRIEGTDK